MYTSKQFAADEMKAWEENAEDDKNDWDFIVNFFSTKMTAINKFTRITATRSNMRVQKSEAGGGTSGRGR